MNSLQHRRARSGVRCSRARLRRSSTRLVACCAALLGVGSLATAAQAAPGAQVSTFTLHRIQAAFGDATYLPTRLPFGYRYERWQRLNGHLMVVFRQKQGNDRFGFQVERLPKSTACDLGGAFHKTLQMDGNKVYYRGEAGEWIAWRCVTSPATKTIYLLSTHSRGPLPDVALARVTASGKRFAR
jgi:hypothetical protein